MSSRMIYEYPHPLNIPSEPHGQDHQNHTDHKGGSGRGLGRQLVVVVVVVVAAAAAAVVPTRRIGDGEVLRRVFLSVCRPQTVLSLWQFCNFADLLQDVASSKTPILAKRGFLTFCKGNLLIFMHFCIFAAGIH